MMFMPSWGWRLHADGTRVLRRLREYYVTDGPDGLFVIKALYRDGSSVTLAEYESREAAFDALRQFSGVGSNR